MRHFKKGRKLHREAGQRRALLRTLAYSLFAHGTIKTTEAKAKELRPFAEKLISYGKTGNTAKKRLIAAALSPKAIKSVMQIAEKMKTRNGGYTRIIKTGRRASDGSKTALIQLL